ncbi:transcriptional regulator [Enterobacter quasiroggenkampii]|uniref:transcriptional regulator n=1 Tax=Enterobacter quasiroggenkampii TaxID=2497436 RepID=UPI003B987368
MAVLTFTLSACNATFSTTKNILRNVMTLSDHQRAVSALDANDADAAQNFLTGRGFKNRYAPIEGAESWGSLQYRAAKIVVSAEGKGQKVSDESLYLARLTLFEAEEGLPERPDIMLDYMHKAMALLLENPRLLDTINSDYVRTFPGQFTLERYAVWQYLSDGGEIDWTKKAIKGEGKSIAGVSYREWNIRLKKTLWNRGDIFIQNLNKSQFIFETIDYSQFPVVACVAKQKGWSLTLPNNYTMQNFRGGGKFDWATCSKVTHG